MPVTPDDQRPSEPTPGSRCATGLSCCGDIANRETGPRLRGLSPVGRAVTVEQLITALSQYPPDRRVVVPGQEFGLSDVGDVQSCRFSF